MVNRSQQDIISQRNIGEARAAELEFFNAHAEYSSVTAHCGLHNLAKALNHILVEHIRALLPSLKTSIEDMLDKRFHELKLYGDPMSGQSAGSRSDTHLSISTSIIFATSITIVSDNCCCGYMSRGFQDAALRSNGSLHSHGAKPCLCCWPRNCLALFVCGEKST